MRTRAVVGAGVLGSALLTIGGYGVGAPPERLDIPLALPLCVAGVLLLLGAWWLVRDGETRTVLTASAWWALPLLVAPPLFSRDLYAYAGQAQLVLSGLDPYAVGPSAAPGPLADEVDDVWLDTPSPYGPVFLRLAAGIVALTGERPLVAAFGLRLLAVAGLVLLAWGLVRLARSHGAPAGRVVWLGLANPLVLLHGVGGGHNDLLMLGLAVLGLSVATPSVTAAAALIALGSLVKAPVLLMLLFLPVLASGPWLRRIGLVVVGSAATAAAVTVACGLGVGWTGTLSGGEARRSLLSVSTGLGVALGQVDAVQLIGTALAAAAVLALLLSARRDTALRHLGLALLGAVLLAPVVQPWYLLWALPVLAVALDPRWARAVAAGSAVLCLLILPSGRHLIRPPLYGVPTLLVLAAAVASSRWPSLTAAHPGLDEGDRAGALGIGQVAEEA